jgi:hypothetical protein
LWPGFRVFRAFRDFVARTRFFFTAVGRKGHGGARADAFPGWAPFVMTLEREFFMTQHWLNEAGKKNVFHSGAARAARLDFVQKRKTASAPQAAPRPAIAIGRQAASGVLAPGYTQTPPSGG